MGYAGVVELVFVRDLGDVTPDDALDRVRAQLPERRFAPETGGDAPGAWKRGGGWRSLFAMDMAHLRTRLEIETSPLPAGSRLTLRYEVGDFGQFITATNRQFWDVEASELADAAAGLPRDETRRSRYDADAARAARAFLAWSLVAATGLSAVIIGVVWSLIAQPS